MPGCSAEEPCGASLRYLFSREAPQPHSSPSSPRTARRGRRSRRCPGCSHPPVPLCQVLRGRGVILARGTLGRGLFLMPVLLEVGSGVSVIAAAFARPPAAPGGEWMFTSRLRHFPSSGPPPVGRGLPPIPAESRYGAGDLAACGGAGLSPPC